MATTHESYIGVEAHFISFAIKVGGGWGGGGVGSEIYR